MEKTRPSHVGMGFVMYTPNGRLARFHNRSPWLMLPRSAHELGYESTLICAELAYEPPKGVQIVQTGMVVKGPPGTGFGRSIFEPLLAFREIVRRGRTQWSSAHCDLHWFPSCLLFMSIAESFRASAVARPVSY